MITDNRAAAAETFTLAHLSDLHLTSLAGLRPRELLNKRLLGYGSWWLSRRHEHRPEVLAALARDLRDHKPDHVAITGDLTHLGTPGECREAAAWLRAFATPAQASVVPGNHDVYVRAPWAETIGLWSAYMTDDATEPRAAPSSVFPFLRRRGPLALIGLSSAVPSKPIFALGRLGAAQLAALDRLLAATAAEGLPRIVLIHHPPLSDTVGWRKGLKDAAALRAVIARRGAELVLHGHAHRSVRGELRGPAGPVPVFGVPSASAFGRHGGCAAYHLYRLSHRADRWWMEVRERTLDADSASFRDGGTQRLQIFPPTPAAEKWVRTGG